MEYLPSLPNRVTKSPDFFSKKKKEPISEPRCNFLGLEEIQEFTVELLVDLSGSAGTLGNSLDEKFSCLKKKKLGKPACRILGRPLWTPATTRKSLDRKVNWNDFPVECLVGGASL